MTDAEKDPLKTQKLPKAERSPLTLSWERQLVQMEGAEQPLPKYNRDHQLCIYYCKYCQTSPEVSEGEVAVAASHDNCALAANGMFSFDTTR